MPALQLPAPLRVPAACRALYFCSGLLYLWSLVAQKCSFYPCAVCFPPLIDTRDGDGVGEVWKLHGTPPNLPTHLLNVEVPVLSVVGKGPRQVSLWLGSPRSLRTGTLSHPKAPSSPGAGQLLLPPG